MCITRLSPNVLTFNLINLLSSSTLSKYSIALSKALPNKEYITHRIRDKQDKKGLEGRIAEEHHHTFIGIGKR